MINLSRTLVYKDSEGQYFAEAGKQGTKIDPIDISDIQDVKVYADKRTGLPLIPDYDTAIHGSKKSSIDKEFDPEYGFVRPEEKELIPKLQHDTHNMIRHGADTENPVGYKFEMTKDTPYTMYTPDGSVHSIDNEKDYVSFINDHRSKGYDLVLNPRTGVEMKDGKYVLPPEDLRINYEQIDKDIAHLRDSAPTPQTKLAREISNKDIELKQLAAVVPEAAYAMAREKAEQSNQHVPNFEEFKIDLHKRKMNLQSDLRRDMQSYKETYGAPSPTEKQYVQRTKRIRDRETNLAADRPQALL